MVVHFARKRSGRSARNEANSPSTYTRETARRPLAQLSSALSLIHLVGCAKRCRGTRHVSLLKSCKGLKRQAQRQRRMSCPVTPLTPTVQMSRDIRLATRLYFGLLAITWRLASSCFDTTSHRTGRHNLEESNPAATSATKQTIITAERRYSVLHDSRML